MVLGSQLYGGRDYEPGVPAQTLGSAGVTSASLSGTINLTSGTQYGIIDNIEVYGVAQSISSSMSTGFGMIFSFTVTVDGVSGGVFTELYPYLAAETSVIKEDRTMIPVNARFNSSASIAWTATVQGSPARLQTNHIGTIRVNGQRSS